MKSLYCNSKQVYSCVQLMHVSLRNGRCGPAEVKENKQQEKEQKFVWRTKTLEFSSVRVSVRSLSNHQTVPDTIKPPPHYVYVCMSMQRRFSLVCVCVCARAFPSVSTSWCGSSAVRWVCLHPRAAPLSMSLLLSLTQSDIISVSCRAQGQRSGVSELPI